MTITRHGTTRRTSDSVVHRGTVYLVEVPQHLDADITAQTRDVLGRIDGLLAQAGSDRSRLLLATIILADLADYEGMNAVWDAWIPPGCAPARACVQARLSHPAMRIELVVVAATASGAVTDTP